MLRPRPLRADSLREPLAWMTAAILIAVAGTCNAQGGSAQQGRESALQELQRRNAELEQRLRRVEQTLEAQAEDDWSNAEESEDFGLMATYGSTVVTFELFGDVGFDYHNPEPAGESNSAFALGSVDFFVNAQIGEHFRLLSETVVDGGTGDTIKTSQERLWGQWEFNDSLYLKLGTEHSRISRWNQLYHHGQYLEPTIERPILVQFEGHEGILPMHHTGIEIGGAIHGEVGTLDYFAAVSNGRGEVPTDKQRLRDRNSSKKIDAGLSFLPTCAPGLRLGGSVTFDDIPPVTSPGPMTPFERSRSLREFIAAANVELELENWDFLGELAWITHEARATDEDFGSHSGYLQAIYRCGDWAPYARFDYRNMSEGDPFYSALDRDLDQWRQTLGVRCDVEENVAIKVEVGVGREEQRNTATSIGERTTLFVGFQLAWSL